MTDSSPAQQPAFVGQLRRELLSGIPAHRRRRHRRNLAAVSMVSVLAVAALVTNIWNDGGSGGEQRSTVIAGAAEGPPAEVIDDASALRWTELAEATNAFSEEAAGGRVNIHRVAAIDSGYFAFGDVTAETSSRLAVWRSADGVRWEQVFETELIGRPRDAVTAWLGEAPSVSVVGIASQDGTIMAAVDDQNGAASSSILRSTDGGSTWTSLPFHDEYRVAGLAAVDGGFVAVASPVDLTSRDDVGTVLVTIFMAPDASAEDHDAVEAVIVADPAVIDFSFVDKAEAKAEFDELFAESPSLVDSVEAPDLPTSYRVTYAARADWTELRDQTLASTENVSRVLTGQTAALPVERNPGRAIAWHSSDGRRWEQAGDIRQDLEARILVNDVVSDGSTVVAVGSVHVERDSRAAAWTSIDGGRSWSTAEVAAPSAAGSHVEMTAAAAGGDGFVAAGTSQIEFPGREGMTADSSDPNRTTRIDLASHLWTSTDGQTWNSEPSPGANGDRSDARVATHPAPFIFGREQAEAMMVGAPTADDLESRVEIAAAVETDAGYLVFIETTQGYPTLEAQTKTSVYRVQPDG